MSDKTVLRIKITNYLKEVDPETSILGAAIHGAIKFDGNNFDNILEQLISQYHDCPDGVINVVGAVPMLLVLQYSKM